MDSRYFTLIKGDRDEILEAVHKAIVSYERFWITLLLSVGISGLLISGNQAWMHGTMSGATER